MLAGTRLPCLLLGGHGVADLLGAGPVKAFQSFKSRSLLACATFALSHASVAHLLSRHFRAHPRAPRLVAVDVRTPPRIWHILSTSSRPKKAFLVVLGDRYSTCLINSLRHQCRFDLARRGTRPNTSTVGWHSRARGRTSRTRWWRPRRSRCQSLAETESLVCRRNSGVLPPHLGVLVLEAGSRGFPRV